MEYPIYGDGSFGLYIALSDMADDGKLFTVRCSDKEVMRFERVGGSISVCIDTGIGTPILLSAPEAKGSLMLEWRGYSVRLFADDALADEEWPLGALPSGEWETEVDEGVPFWEFSELRAREEPCVPLERPVMFIKPEGHNTGMGDLMPYNDNGVLRLFYLHDRRSHKSKYGLGAHRWAQICMDEKGEWTRCPLAIDIDRQWEGSVCTGSLIRTQEGLCAYYAVRMADRTAAKIGRAVSTDGIHFTKTEEYFELKAPYEPVSARDPMVFQTDDGLYHMLVTTSVGEEGALAHLTSQEGREWRQMDEPFLLPGWKAQPECPDWFRWGNRYYLVFSIGAQAYYCMSGDPLSGWTRPRLLCGRGINVPKTTAWGTGRIAAGFLCDAGYAGNLVLYELEQKEDGSIGCRFFEKALPRLAAYDTFGSVSLASCSGRKTAALCETGDTFRLRLSAAVKSGSACIGIGGYDLVISSENTMQVLDRDHRSITEKTDIPAGAADIDIHASGGMAAALVNGVPAAFRTGRANGYIVSLSSLWGECDFERISLLQDEKE